MQPSLEADVLMELLEILETINEDLWSRFKLPGESRSCLPPTATLEEMGIGGPPIGHGELLQLKDQIEKHFGIRFSDDELPDFFVSRKITFQQIVDAIIKKVQAR